MSAFAGLDDLIRALESMPEELRQQAVPIVDDAAEQMAAELVQRYPRGEGQLRDGVVVDRSAASALRIKVRSKAPHAHLYEYGTVQRSLASNGANRGTMPAQPTFVPIAVRKRREMVERLTDMVNGVRVSGMTGSAGVGRGGRFL